VTPRGGKMEMKMEIVRQIVDSRLLDTVIPLPKSFLDKKVEVIVMPTTEDTGKPSLSRSAIDSMLEGSITQSLLGAVPDTGLSIEDIRSERLSKYERFD
jgi:hypothetical protein